MKSLSELLTLYSSPRHLREKYATQIAACQHFTFIYYAKEILHKNMGNNDVSVDMGTFLLISGSFYIRRLVSLSISVPNCVWTNTVMRKRSEHLQREGREHPSVCEAENHSACFSSDSTVLTTYKHQHAHVRCDDACA